MNGIKIIKFVLLLLLSLSSGSCVFEKFAEVSTGEEPVKVGFSSRAFTQSGVTIKTFRIIAFNSSGSPEINKTMDDLVISGNNLTLDLRPGMYTLFAIGNECADMTPSLDGVASEQVVDQVRINMIENQDSTTLPVAWKKTIYVRQKAAGSDIGQISLNNKDWLDRMEMETERLASKIEIYVRKESVSDVVTVKAVTPKNMPKFSYITPMSYGGEYYSTPLNTNYKVTDEQTLLTDRIYPEHIPAQPSSNTLVELEMEINGVAQKAFLEIGQLDRNKLYRYEVLVKSRGIEIENIHVLPWNEISTDENIQGVQINFSKVEVPYSYNQESKVFFTTKNVHPDNLRLSSGLYDSNDGTTIVGNLYDFFDAVTDYTYSYDAGTRVGRGVLTIKRKKASLDKHRINIYASGLTKSILVDALKVAGSNIYWDSSRNSLAFDDTPAEGERALHERYQGMYFKYGALAAIPGSNSQTKTMWSASGASYSDFMTSLVGVTETDQPASMTNLPFYPDNDKGDICVYLTRRGLAPGVNKNKKWRLPTKDDMRELSAIYEGTNTSISDGSITGEIDINTGLRVSNKYFFPSSGSRRPSNELFQLGVFYRYMLNSPAFSGNSLYTFQGLDDKPYIHDAVSRPNNYLTVRCVSDDDRTPILKLYQISYDIEMDLGGGVSVTIPGGIVKNQYADAGGSIKLSETVLTSSDGRVHNGWIINGKEYELGAVVSNIQSDMVAQPRWFGHNINGIVWASTDLAASKKFAANPEFISKTASGGNFFSWNSLTPGSIEEGSYDPQRDPCPDGWEVPSAAQIMDLIGFTVNKPLKFAGTRNGVKGYWFGIDRQPNESELRDYLFIRCSGYFYIDSYFWPDRFMLVSDELNNADRVKYAYADLDRPDFTITFIEGSNKNLASPIRCVRTNW